MNNQKSKLGFIGLIRKIFILKKIERLTAGELALQNYLNESSEELSRLKLSINTVDRILFLKDECTKSAIKIIELQEKNKKARLSLT
jgi:hypothetical protein